MKVEAALARRQETGWLTAGRLLWLVPLTATALLLAWWVYATFIDKPPRPDAPVSTARAATAGAWATQEGGNTGTRMTAAPSHIGGVEAWRVSLGSPVATPLVTDGRIVVAVLEDGRAVALDAASGKQSWAASLGTPPFAAPVIAGDRVYLGQREGRVLVLSAADGKELWHSRYVAGSFESSPVVVDGIVYAYSTDGIFAFDAEDGRILWEQVFDAGWATVTPVVEGNYLVVATAERAIVFDRTSGRQTYYVTFSRAQPSSLSVEGGDVLAVYGRNATLFDVTSGRPWWDGLRTAWFRFHLIGMAPAVPPLPTVWDVTSLPRATLAAAFTRDAAVVASPDGAVTALSRSDGTARWTAKLSRLAAAPVVTADGVLLVEEGRLVLLDAASGQPRAERKAAGVRSVAPTEAATYVATSAGDVIALR